MSDTPINKCRLAWSLGVASLLTLVAALPIDPNQWALTRHGISQGEWWRILSGQCVHFGWMHAALNIAGFLVISLGFSDRIRPTQEAWVLLVCMLGVGSGILLWTPDIEWYVGISGALYGLLVHHVIISHNDTPPLSKLILLGVAGKLGYEQLWAPPDRLTEQLIGGPVAIDAHLYGALMGALFALLWHVASRLNHPRS